MSPTTGADMNDPHLLRQCGVGDVVRPRAGRTSVAPSVDDIDLICLVVDATGTVRWANESGRRVLRLDGRHALDLTALAHRNDRSHLGALIREALVMGSPRETLVELVPPEPGVPRQVHLVLSPGHELAGEAHDGAPEIVVQGWDVTDLLHRARRFPAHRRRDQLTGLTSRSALTDRLGREIACSVHTGHGLALIVAEVDGMSAVDDTYGRRAGDQVRATLYGRLAGSLRPGDTLARVGSDEFAVICSDLSDPGDAMRVVDRLRLTANEPISTGTGELTLTLTVGAAFTSDYDHHDGRDGVALLLRRADQAIGEARIGNRGMPSS
jgi:diguanylate cyclase (GGDEF)-like protein